MNLLDELAVRRLVEAALEEDAGRGDVTTEATVEPQARGSARIVSKEAEEMVFCGGALISPVFTMTGAEPRIAELVPDGTRLRPGAVACRIEGRLAGLLVGERTALNFLQLMSGIATLTARFVRAVAGTRARIVDTRKTHPGLRLLEKYAVRTGGGFNHRHALDSGILIKENHIAAAGSVAEALARARARAPHCLRIEIECETRQQVEEALEAGADAILLDNMKPDEVRRIRAIVGEGVLVEVSGGITLENVREYAEAGADLISVGALTHSARAADLSMRFVK